MPKSPAFQFYPGDFLSDGKQSVMELEEVGAYTRLICACWLEGNIPTEMRKLAKLAGTTTDMMRKLWPAIEPCFEKDPACAGYLIHPRLEKERAKQAAFKEKKRAAGKRGASARWTGDAVAKEPDSTAIVLPLAENGSSASAVSSVRSSASAVSSSSHSGEEAPSPAFNRLVAYVGEQHRELAEAVSRKPKATSSWASSVLANCGPGELLDPTMERIPEEHRPRVLALALSRYAADAQDWSTPYFRTFVARAWADRLKGASEDADVAKSAERHAQLKPVIHDRPVPAKPLDGDAQELVKKLAGKFGGFRA